MDERRSSQRTRTIQGGKVVFGDFRYTIDCMVRDISATGARIKVKDVSEIPDSFHLFDNRTSLLKPARVAWRSEREVGVEFTGEPIDVYASHDMRLARFKHL